MWQVKKKKGQALRQVKKKSLYHPIFLSSLVFCLLAFFRLLWLSVVDSPDCKIKTNFVRYNHFNEMVNLRILVTREFSRIGLNFIHYVESKALAVIPSTESVLL
jgi:hypothetical protein